MEKAHPRAAPRLRFEDARHKAALQSSFAHLEDREETSSTQAARLAREEGRHTLAHAYQRQALKREYRRSRKAAESAREAAQAARKRAARAAGRLFNKRHLYLLLALGAMLVLIIQSLSACSPLVESALNSLVIGTYPAEVSDIKKAEQYYLGMENDLKNRIKRYQREHPGYDAYDIQAQSIWHDPYALISLVSAYYGGEDEWKIDDVYGILRMLFDWQYELTESTETETRFRTETREGETVEVPYAYVTRHVFLKNKVLSRAPVYIMEPEKVGMYALYMSTLGNMPDLFRGGYASTLKDPLEYEVPQELLDADPKFALLAKAADECLGYPYVWGGYTPQTSFDCSGFISWLFTSTGIVNIGHEGAQALYNRSRHIRPEEALPGDVVFFVGTITDEEGVTHCGLYVGNNMMIHCGNPCSYADLSDPYWQEHFCGFGRLYER